MHADLMSIVCKFGGDPVICLREEAICAKVYRRTDGNVRTDDGRRAIALAHSWNELKIGVVQDQRLHQNVFSGLYVSIIAEL